MEGIVEAYTRVYELMLGLKIPYNVKEAIQADVFNAYRSNDAEQIQAINGSIAGLSRLLSLDEYSLSQWRARMLPSFILEIKKSYSTNQLSKALVDLYDESRRIRPSAAEPFVDSRTQLKVGTRISGPVDRDFYEIVAITAPGVSIFNMTSNWLYFNVTKNGSCDETPILQKAAGSVTSNEMMRLVEPGLEKNEVRVSAIDQLTKELESRGWEYVGVGDYWYSKRFKKKY